VGLPALQKKQRKLLVVCVAQGGAVLPSGDEIGQFRNPTYQALDDPLLELFKLHIQPFGA